MDGLLLFLFLFFFSFPERQETPHVIPSLARLRGKYFLYVSRVNFFHGFNFICLC